MIADPLCTCGHTRAMHDDGVPECVGGMMRCLCKAFEGWRIEPESPAPGSLEDILGVWRDQGPFPLRNTADVALLVDEILRLRALVDCSGCPTKDVCLEFVSDACRAEREARAEIERLRAENEAWRERKKRAVRALLGVYERGLAAHLEPLNRPTTDPETP